VGLELPRASGAEASWVPVQRLISRYSQHPTYEDKAFSKAFQKQLLRGVSAVTPPLYTVALWNKYITYDNAIS
jgi:hypothetical protein